CLGHPSSRCTFPYVGEYVIISIMIERFIPVAITTQVQLAQHVTSGRLGYSLQPHITQQMGEMRWQYAPTHEARDPWPGERLFEHSLWTDDSFALTNERPLTGSA